MKNSFFFKGITFSYVTLLSLKKVSSGEEKQKDMKEMR